MPDEDKRYIELVSYENLIIIMLLVMFIHLVVSFYFIVYLSPDISLLLKVNNTLVFYLLLVVLLIIIGYISYRDKNKFTNNILKISYILSNLQYYVFAYNLILIGIFILFKVFYDSKTDILQLILPFGYIMTSFISNTILSKYKFIIVQGEIKQGDQVSRRLRKINELNNINLEKHDTFTLYIWYKIGDNIRIKIRPEKLNAAVIEKLDGLYKINVNGNSLNSPISLELMREDELLLTSVIRPLDIVTEPVTREIYPVTRAQELRKKEYRVRTLTFRIINTSSSAKEFKDIRIYAPEGASLSEYIRRLKSKIKEFKIVEVTDSSGNKINMFTIPPADNLYYVFVESVSVEVALPTVKVATKRTKTQQNENYKERLSKISRILEELGDDIW